MTFDHREQSRKSIRIADSEFIRSAEARAAERQRMLEVLAPKRATVVKLSQFQKFPTVRAAEQQMHKHDKIVLLGCLVISAILFVALLAGKLGLL